jgi:nitrogen regulatory protein P-II 2
MEATMDLTTLKLVTIIAEAVLEDRLLSDVQRLGATGYTLTEVRGEGSRGIRAADFEGRNLRIETLVAPATADRLLQHLADEYFPLYAVVAFAADVQVVRGEKYIRAEDRSGG